MGFLLFQESEHKAHLDFCPGPVKRKFSRPKSCILVKKGKMLWSWALPGSSFQAHKLRNWA